MLARIEHQHPYATLEEGLVFGVVSRENDFRSEQEQRKDTR
jgi:hypothetical protein